LNNSRLHGQFAAGGRNVGFAPNYANRCGCEYFYIFKDGDWQYAQRGSQYFGLSDGSPFSEFKPLPQEIAG
jgi:hypothetical protein